ncbi:MAG: GTA-gp10 family protein, partial [Terricaulis sp.]
MPEPHNRARGEVLLEIDGRQVRLCLTLGVLAELEAAFDVVSLNQLGERLAHLS